MAKKGSKKEKKPKQQGGGKKAKQELVFCNSEDCFEYAPAGQKYCGPCQPKAEPVLGRETSLRTHNCGQLRASDIGKDVQLIGWVQTARDINHFAFVDIRDRYGITQCVFTNPGENPTSGADKAAKECYQIAQKLGREYVIRIQGKVRERSNKNLFRDTGDIEIIVSSVVVENESLTPPFLIEDETDANEEPRMRYRYLDIRRNPVKEGLMLRAKCANLIRNFLPNLGFLEVETPVLIKSTPEGARDFIVPSRMNPGQFYALPQSPQTFKQILMVAGLDRYFQIVKCFRDEELRADRQPEFTQIDCEMSFVNQEDVLSIFESMVTHIFKEMVGHTFPPFPRMTYADAMRDYGIDKPDIRFDMKLCDLTALAKGHGLAMFDESEAVLAIACPGQAVLAGKKLKELEAMCKSSIVGAKAMVWVKVNSLKEGKLDLPSSVAKFFSMEELAAMATKANAKEGDLMMLLFGPEPSTRDSMGRLRHEMGTRLGLRSEGFKGLWVVDFPLLEWDEEAGRFSAMHHPFTSPKLEDVHLMETDPGKVRANAYDMCINGVEMGGGSIRIHTKELQHQVFKLLGFTKEAAEEQFGFLLGAFEYGAPPHGGLAFGFDRMCTILGGSLSIRDYIAFPKNNMGRDMMINSPSPVSLAQLDELKLECIPVEAKVEQTKKA